jgi:hypothetical protein
MILPQSRSDAPRRIQDSRPFSQSSIPRSLREDEITRTRANAALRRFKVMDDERLSDDLAAWACFRLDRLQPGLRMLHLYDSNGVVTKGVLLVRIKKTVSMERTDTW